MGEVIAGHHRHGCAACKIAVVEQAGHHSHGVAHLLTRILFEIRKESILVAAIELGQLVSLFGNGEGDDLERGVGGDFDRPRKVVFALIGEAFAQ